MNDRTDHDYSGVSDPNARAILRELDQIHGGIKELNLKYDRVVVEDIAVLRVDLGRVEAAQVAAQVVQTKFVTKDEFRPIQRLVWGFVTLVLTGVIVGILGLVVKNNSMTPAHGEQTQTEEVIR